MNHALTPCRCRCGLPGRIDRSLWLCCRCAHENRAPYKDCIHCGHHRATVHALDAPEKSATTTDPVLIGTAGMFAGAGALLAGALVGAVREDARSNSTIVLAATKLVERVSKRPRTSKTIPRAWLVDLEKAVRGK